MIQFFWIHFQKGFRLINSPPGVRSKPDHPWAMQVRKAMQKHSWCLVRLSPFHFSWTPHSPILWLLSTVKGCVTPTGVQLLTPPLYFANSSAFSVIDVISTSVSWWEREEEHQVIEKGRWLPLPFTKWWIPVGSSHVRLPLPENNL